MDSISPSRCEPIAIGIAILLALVLALYHSPTALSRDLDVSEFPKEFTYFKYDEGHISSHAVVRPGNPIYDALLSFIAAHGSGWRSDMKTYSPQLYFVSKDVRLNCRDDIVVVNARQNNSAKWAQLSTNVIGCKTLLLGATPAN